jgi:nondiscriminating glutamyl-tRNA synthetase
MPPERSSAEATPPVNPFTAADVVDILRERGWLSSDPSPEHLTWCAHAAALLGAQTADRNTLADLLHLVFYYDAAALMANVETHAILARYAARDVLREVALALLDGGPLTSQHFKEIIDAMKFSLDLRGRDLFHPLRLALAGRTGDGELDRVILLLDGAAALPFDSPVKSARRRILEFCAALD